MKTKAIQYFTEENLKMGKELTPEQILKFLDDFRSMHAGQAPSKLISIKIPQNLLDAFKFKASLEKIPYQTKIKILMKDWLDNSSRNR